MTQENRWYILDSGEHLPRLWLALPEGNLLIGWETVGKVKASVDFLSVSFESEFGLIQIDCDVNDEKCIIWFKFKTSK